MEGSNHPSSTSKKPLPPTENVSPNLPLELERLIFELAVLDIGPKRSTTLLLVARRVYNWIRPLVYRVFNQMGKPPLPDFKRYPQLMASVGHLAEWLMVGYGSGFPYPLNVLLSFCPNIVVLASWTIPIRPLLPIVDKLPLRRLSANFDDFTYDDFLMKPFVNVTHLEVVSFLGNTWDRNFEALIHLPNLTHLSVIEHAIKVEVIPQLFHHCYPLRILIIILDHTLLRFQEDDAEERLAEINDNRLVLLESPPFPGLVHDWEKGAHGGIDCWAFGELVSLAQSRSYFVDPPPRHFPRVRFDWKKHLNREGLKWFANLHLHDPVPNQDELYELYELDFT